MVTSVRSHISSWLAPILYFLGRWFVLPLYFGQIQVIGQEHLPQTGPVLIAPTHRSRWDAFMVPYAAGRLVTGRDLRFMVSADEMLGIQGWFIRRFGGFPVDTTRPAIASLRHGIELLQAGETLVIFPEGNIFRQDEIQSLKPGLARMAIQAAADRLQPDIQLVPMIIRYGQPIPRWGCQVEIKIGSPLNVTNYCQGSIKQAAQELTRDLQTALETLVTGEVESPKVVASAHPLP